MFSKKVTIFEKIYAIQIQLEKSSAKIFLTDIKLVFVKKLIDRS